MIKISGNDIMRNGVKLGWITQNHFFNHIGKKMGYTTSDTVFDENAKKLARLSGEYLYYPGSEKKIRLEDVIADIESPSLPNIQRVAIRIFYGN
jgi:hypothetical protein